MDRNFSCSLKACCLEARCPKARFLKAIRGCSAVRRAALRNAARFATALLVVACAPSSSSGRAGSDLLDDGAGQIEIGQHAGKLEGLIRFFGGLLARDAAGSLAASANACSRDSSMEASCDLAIASIAFLAMRQRHQARALDEYVELLRRIDGALNPGFGDGYRWKRRTLRRLLGEGSLVQRYWAALEAEFGLGSRTRRAKNRGEAEGRFARAVSGNVTDLLCSETPHALISCAERPLHLSRSVIHAQTALAALTARPLATAMLRLLLAELEPARLAEGRADRVSAAAPAGQQPPPPDPREAFESVREKLSLAPWWKLPDPMREADARLQAAEACFTDLLLHASFAGRPPGRSQSAEAPQLASQLVSHLHSLFRSHLFRSHDAAVDHAMPWLIYTLRSFGLLYLHFGSEGICKTACIAALHEGGFFQNVLASLLFERMHDADFRYALLDSLYQKLRISREAYERTAEAVIKALVFLETDFLENGCADPSPRDDPLNPS